MNLESAQFPFVLLTPCFSGTAEGKTARSSVMRVPPIRGHVRFWHRVLSNADSANRIWGSTAGNGGSSLVALRLDPAALEEARASRLLPHVEFTPAERDEFRRLERGNRDDPRFKELKQKKAKAESERPAVQPQAMFTLTLQRLVGCTALEWNVAQSAVKLWLLVGCLGLRSNRAAGSVWPLGKWPDGSAIPITTAEFKMQLQTLGLRWAVSIAGLTSGPTVEGLRATASDTVNDVTLFGGIKPSRKPSPVKFKVIKLGNMVGLLIVARTAPELVNAEAQLLRKPSPRRWLALGPWTRVLP